METVFRQTLALWLGNGDEHRPLESDTTGQKLSRGTFTLCLFGHGLRDGHKENFVGLGSFLKNAIFPVLETHCVTAPIKSNYFLGLHGSSEKETTRDGHDLLHPSS